MRKIIIFILCSLFFVPIKAQTNTKDVQKTLDEARMRLEEFDTEHLLDSLDQEKLPRIVSGGILGGANISNFIITRNHQPMSSYMRIGGEIGGFIDFRISKHFSIQPQVIFTAQQNYFAATDTTNTLCSAPRSRFISWAASVIWRKDTFSLAAVYTRILRSLRT